MPFCASSRRHGEGRPSRTRATDVMTTTATEIVDLKAGVLWQRVPEKYRERIRLGSGYRGWTENEIEQEWNGASVVGQRHALSLAVLELSGDYEAGQERLTVHADPETVRLINGDATKPRMAVRNAASVTPKRRDWRWPGWLPEGSFLLINGRQGDGKGLIGCSLIGSLTNGSLLPDG
jgi:hypothetical protein